jgi:folate-binding protein YgfZ
MKYDLQKDIRILQIIGQDAKQFLNSIITNQINHNSIYAFILSSNGRYLFDFFIHAIQDSYLIEVHNSLFESLLDKLNFYKLRRKISIYDRSEDLSALYSHQVNHDFEYESCMQDSRYTALGQRIILKKDFAKEYKQSNIYMLDKYQYCIPDGHSDMVQNKSIILEFGAELLSAVSFSKGCFPGQELIARTKYSGKLTKMPYKILALEEIDLANVEKRTTIFDNSGSPIGIFCSGSKNLGIAIAKRDLVGAEKLAYLNNQQIKLEIPKWQV